MIGEDAAAAARIARPPGAITVVLTVLVPFGLGYYLSYLYRTVNVVLAPNLAADLALGPAALGLLTSVYFAVFGAFQVPLGVLLDRYGPRRVQAVLLLFAAAGSGFFAVGDDLAVATLGRGLIGLGVSGCLMAALKANAMWWPRERLPLVNGVAVAFGTLGALSATVPVNWLLGLMGWRAIFAMLAAATLAVVVLTWLVVPESDRGRAPRGGGWSGQIRDLRQIYGSGLFWRVAAIGCLHNAAFLGYQTLWMGAWLRDVAGMAPSAVAQSLLLFNLGMLAGVLGIGAIAERVQRIGVSTTIVMGTGVALSIATQFALALEATAYARLLCVAFGFFGSSTLLNYAILNQHFPAHLVGRANTAQNMLVFVGAFCAQWGVGAIINRWPALADGRYDPAAHRAALAVLIALELVAFAWLLWPQRRKARHER